PHKFLRISSFGSPVALPFVSFGTPSGHYDDRTDVALQNRTDHELSTSPTKEAKNPQFTDKPALS
ncbi:MAG: hypothetical protein SCG83_00165, partial [Nitrosomonadaceae bacterium]|nr:hypothetical protein [Nitrosomonadaceae bacterium]